MFLPAIEQHVNTVLALREQEDTVWYAAEVINATFRAGGRLLLCGNGGSAADCQHIAAELVGRFRRERAPLPAIALTTDTSALTAVANDYGYDEVFRRQVLALMRPQDTLLCLSTSGKSESVLRAASAARELGGMVLAFTGQAPSPLAFLAHATLRVPSSDTARVQECHILLGHIICDILESK